MLFDLANADLFNVVRRDGDLRVRGGYGSVNTPYVNNKYVYGFSVESPFTEEVWHYTFTRNVDSGLLICRVFNWQFVRMYELPIGYAPPDIVITHAITNNQILVNSPDFSAPLYGSVGGGLILAVKTESINPDTTALEIPTGHVASFGDRMVIAQNNILFFNDPGVDPRTFVAQNTIAIPSGGDIYDLFQGDDGALYVFTSKGTFYVPQDALGRGQLVEGFLGMVPGIETTYERNAASSCGVVVAIQKDGLVTVGRGGAAIPLTVTKAGQRAFPVIRSEDHRATSRVYAGPEGFFLAMGDDNGTVFEFNVRNGYRAFHSVENVKMNLVGVLRDRDGAHMLMLEDRVLGPTLREHDWNNQSVSGGAVVEVDVPEGVTVKARRVTVSTEATDATVYSESGSASRLTPVQGITIGISLWDAGKLFTRRPKTTRHGISLRTTHLTLEVKVSGGDKRIERNIEIDFLGQGRKRGDRR